MASLANVTAALGPATRNATSISRVPEVARVC